MSADQPAASGAAGDAMASFRERARVTNLARADVISDALDSLAAGALADDARLTAHRAAHSVAGSAGTFGFTEASRLGHTLEELLDENAVDGTEDTDDARAREGLEVVARLRAALGGAEVPGSSASGGDRPLP